MLNFYNQLLENNIKKENIQMNEKMSKHTSFKTGGVADFFIKIYTIDELKILLKLCKKNNLPIFVLGNGTNILVKDEGYRGVIINLKFEDIKINKKMVTVGSGVKNAILAHKLAENSLTGFEFASGIPGTIGGDIKMNAGAYGGEIKDILVNVKCMDYDGNIITLDNKSCEFDYRHSIFFNKNLIILEANFKLNKGKKEEILNKINELNAKRKEKQPLEYPSAGSTFKRGDGFITAMLIDECGLKGYSIGGAEVSEKHAGFIINKNNATTSDILKLIDYVQNKVLDEKNKKIELEIEII